MSNKNSVSLIGRVGQDPEFKDFGDDNGVCNLSLATSEKYKDKDGEQVESTEWHNLVFWGNQAKFVRDYVRKGNRMSIEGKLKTEMWETDAGEKRYKTVITVREFGTFDFNELDEAKGSNENTGSKSRKTGKKATKSEDTGGW